MWLAKLAAMVLCAMASPVIPAIGYKSFDAERSTIITIQFIWKVMQFEFAISSTLREVLLQFSGVFEESTEGRL